MDDDSRWIRCNSVLAVYVPAKEEQTAEDLKRDHPRQDPPQVVYMDVSANFWLVLREKQMPYENGFKYFSPEEMEWLNSIEPQVRTLMQTPARTDGLAGL